MNFPRYSWVNEKLLVRLSCVGISLGSFGLATLDARASTGSELFDAADRMSAMSAGPLLALVNVALVCALVYVFKLLEASNQRREAASALFHEKRDEQTKELMRLVEATAGHIASANAVNATLVSMVQSVKEDVARIPK